MASVITATTSSGLTQSADNSGVLQLASGTGNLVTVPSVTGTAMVSGNMPAFSAYASSNTTLSNATLTKVNFQTEEYDTNNNFASSRFTPTVAGYYQLNSVVNTNYGPGGVIVSFYKNGSEFLRGGNIQSGTAGSSSSGLIYLNGSTDYVETYVLTSLGGSLDADSGAHRVRFDGILVRAA